jgi:uncharacterized membrane protein YgcG
MNRKTFISLCLATIILLTSACGSTKTASTSQGSNTQAFLGGSTQRQSTELTTEAKIALGTLKLETTDLKVTPEQAKELLPLWKAVKTLPNSETTSEVEIQALYTQIQETMTAEQMKAINDMGLTASNMRDVMSELGIQMGGPGGGSGAQATPSSSGSFQGGGGMMPGGGGPGGGMMPPDGGGMMGGAGGTGGSSRTNSTAGAIMPNRSGRGITSMLIEPLIKLLTERAASAS